MAVLLSVEAAAPVTERSPVPDYTVTPMLAEWFFWIVAVAVVVVAVVVIVVSGILRWLRTDVLSRPTPVKFDLNTDLDRARSKLTEDADLQWWDSVQTLAVTPPPSKEQP